MRERGVASGTRRFAGPGRALRALLHGASAAGHAPTSGEVRDVTAMGAPAESSGTIVQRNSPLALSRTWSSVLRFVVV